jgi:hypothetical protein
MLSTIKPTQPGLPSCNGMTLLFARTWSKKPADGVIVAQVLYFGEIWDRSIFGFFFCAWCGTVSIVFDSWVEGKASFLLLMLLSQSCFKGSLSLVCDFVALFQVVCFVPGLWWFSMFAVKKISL